MSTYVITGASGFVGNNLIRLLNTQESDAHIRALVQPGAHTTSLQGLSCSIYEGDITKPDTLTNAFFIPEEQAADGVYVIHCAGIIDISAKPNPSLHKVNVEGTAHVVNATQELAKHISVQPKFIHVASVHAIPEASKGQIITEPDHYDPSVVVGQYAKSKAEAAQLVLDRLRAGDLSGCIMLPSGILGPFDFSPENMKELITKVARGELSVCVTGGYDFVDVRDVVQGILAACHQGKNGRSYLLTNRQVLIKEVCDEARAFAGLPPMKAVLPLWLAKLGAPLCELYYQVKHEVPLFTSYALHTLDSNSHFSHARATAELGYTTRPLQETIFDMMAWMELADGLNS